jgi:PAS domain S-box-containing protein
MDNTFGINIIPDNDPQRIEALKRYQILDTPPEGAFNNVAKLATQIFKVPISLISLVDAEQVFFKANVGMGNVKYTSRGVSLCSLAVLKSEVTVFENAPAEPCLLANPNVAGDFGLKFYAGAPITTSDGFLIGTICVIDKQPRKFSDDERVILEGLAKIVMDEMELRLSAITEKVKSMEANEELSTVNEEMTATNEELTSTIEELSVNKESLDATYEKLSETNQRLNIALDAGAFGSTEVELSTGKMTSTAQFKKCYGRRADEDFNYADLFDAMLPEYRDRVKQLVTIAKENNSIYEAEYEVAWPDGSVHWISAHGRPRYDENGIANRMVGIVSDITAQKEQENRKDDFLGMVSHELKTPITSLRANLQLLDRVKESPTNPVLPRLIDASIRSMDKISSFVDDLLHMHQVKDGQLQLTKSEFNVWNMLNQSCNHIRIAGDHELVISGDRTLNVLADEHRIDQVVVNFVNNAVKYAPEQDIIYLNVSKEGDFAKVAVKDTGPGIPEHQLTHLFDRYWRANHTGKKYSGLGLGLYICAEIIARHGGQVGVDSEIGKGSTFWFTLPL